MQDRDEISAQKQDLSGTADALAKGRFDVPVHSGGIRLMIW